MLTNSSLSSYPWSSMIFDCSWQYKHTQTPSHSAKYIVAATQKVALKMFRCSQCWNGSQKHKLHSTWQRFGRQVRDCERQRIRKRVSSKLEGLTDAELQVNCFVTFSSGFPEQRGCLWTTHIVLQKTGYPAFLRWSVETVHIGPSHPSQTLKSRILQELWGTRVMCRKCSVCICCSVLVFFLKQGLNVYLWLNWNSSYRPGRP